MLDADYYMARAVEQFYLSRKVRGAYAEDCTRESWYRLICWAIAADGVGGSHGT